MHSTKNNDLKILKIFGEDLNYWLSSIASWNSLLFSKYNLCSCFCGIWCDLGFDFSPSASGYLEKTPPPCLHYPHALMAAFSI